MKKTLPVYYSQQIFKLMPRTRPTFSFILAHRHQTTTGCMPKTSFALSAFSVQFKFFFDIWPCSYY